MEKRKKGITFEEKDLKDEVRKLESGTGKHQFKKIIEISSAYKVPQTKTKEEAWTDLHKKIRKGRQDVTITRNIGIYKRIVYPLAASILLLMSIYVVYHYSIKSIIVPPGQQQTVLLPDSSTVLLNADSRLRYSSFNWKNNRKIKFEGEAFFVVKKGGKFEVTCDHGLISVLGTSFNIFSRQNDLEIECFTGSIKVSAFNDSPVLLRGNEAIKYSNGTKQFTTPYEFDPESAATWRKGEYRFEQTPVRNVFDELERQFNIQVDYPYADNRKYTGFFKNDDLKLALDMICIPMDLDYSIIDKNRVKIE
ncbi:MAG: FecR domain-containing protein [Bacteroidales bacterium]|nr:FecR domain-containing protein [Bacteroidales bacterium]